MKKNNCTLTEEAAIDFGNKYSEVIRNQGYLLSNGVGDLVKLFDHRGSLVVNKKCITAMVQSEVGLLEAVDCKMKGILPSFHKHNGVEFPVKYFSSTINESA